METFCHYAVIIANRFACVLLFEQAQHFLDAFFLQFHRITIESSLNEQDSEWNRRIPNDGPKINGKTCKHCRRFNASSDKSMAAKHTPICINWPECCVSVPHTDPNVMVRNGCSFGNWPDNDTPCSRDMVDSGTVRLPARTNIISCLSNNRKTSNFCRVMNAMYVYVVRLLGEWRWLSEHSFDFRYPEDFHLEVRALFVAWPGPTIFTDDNDDDDGGRKSRCEAA